MPNFPSVLLSKTSHSQCRHRLTFKACTLYVCCYPGFSMPILLSRRSESEQARILCLHCWITALRDERFKCWVCRQAAWALMGSRPRRGPCQMPAGTARPTATGLITARCSSRSAPLWSWAWATSPTPPTSTQVSTAHATSLAALLLQCHPCCLSHRAMCAAGACPPIGRLVMQQDACFWAV